MKANKIIRRLVEESFEQVAMTNTLLRQNEQRVERLTREHQRAVESKDQRIADLEAQIRELRGVRNTNLIYKRRLEAAGLDTQVRASDEALEALRQKLMGV